MTAPTVLQIMQGIETQLATVTGLVFVSDIHPGQITTPAGVVGVPPIDDYHAAMRSGVIRLDVPVLILTSSATDFGGQHQLAAYANPTGSSSVKTAIETDRTLGGVVDDCFVRSFAPLGIDEVNTIGYWGGRFMLFIVAQGGT
jgi:hypothetical protein